MATQWEELPGETPIDVSGLVPKAKAQGVTTRKDLNRLEAENIRKAIVKYLAAKPSKSLASFDYSWVLKLHAEMFADVWTWAGQIRTVEVNLGRPVHAIQGELYGLLEDLRAFSSLQMPLVEQATRLHHRAVSIHPFLNGNGRWARLLANIWLKQHEEPLVQWPEQTIGEKAIIREAYIAAIKQADTGDYGPLLEMHRRYS